MRILFIYPNLQAQIGFNYGVACLSAVLKSHGHETRLLNINEKLDYPPDWARIKADIEAFAPDLIGISMVTNQYRYGLEIAKKIKAAFSVPIIAGGIHATADPEGVMASGVFDFLCRGEGENALAELADRMSRGTDVSDIPNLWVRQNNELVKNKVAPFIDLSLLPPKDYEIFDFQKMVDAKGGWVGIMASRGCPYRCSYCFNHQMVNLYKTDLNRSEGALQYIRYHPVETVMAELKYLLHTYRNITTFIFDDDLFTLNKPYLREFTRRYRDEIGLPYVVNAHVKNFDGETALALRGSGCTIVKFGLESGSERVRRNILNRRMTNQDIRKSFEIAHQAGLHTSAFVMFGFPHETREDIQMTIQLLGQIRPGRFRWAIFFPYVHTDAYRTAQEGGFIDREKMASLTNFFEESCLNLGPELNLWLDKLQKIFPWYVNRELGSALSPRYGDLIRQIEALSPQEWDQAKPEMMKKDAELSSQSVQAGELHYAIKYNSFMGVRSDFFLEEEKNAALVPG